MFRKSRVDRLATIAAAAIDGRALMKKHSLTGGDVAVLFAALPESQRRGIMSAYKKDGSVR